MQYPTVNSYLETLDNPRGLFRTLHLEAQIDEHGKLFYCCGNYSVVFKVEMEGVFYAMKCFTRHCKQRFENYRHISARLNDSLIGESLSRAFAKFSYLDREICVAVEGDKYDYFPVVMMEWVEGQTLRSYVKRQCKQNNLTAVAEVRRKMGNLFLDLLSNGIAHGDLKHDNLIVSDSGNLVLVDYDGMYVGEEQGDYSSELGTEQFQHPLRDHLTFDRHIDNYSMILLLTAISMLVEEPSLMEIHGDEDCFVLDSKQIFADQEPLVDQFIIRWLRRGDSHLALMALQLHHALPEIPNIREILVHALQPTQADSDTLTVFSVGRRFGYRDRENRTAIAPLFDSAYEFSDNLALVKFRNKYYFIDQSGAVKIDLDTYKHAEPFSCGRAKVSPDGILWGYIDTAGHQVIECRYPSACGFSENLAAVMYEKMWGYINIFGIFVINSRYDSADSFHNGRAFVSQSGMEKEISYPENLDSTI